LITAHWSATKPRLWQPQLIKEMVPANRASALWNLWTWEERTQEVINVIVLLFLLWSDHFLSNYDVIKLLNIRVDNWVLSNRGEEMRKQGLNHLKSQTTGVKENKTIELR
jgi:hypothetical protein